MLMRVTRITNAGEQPTLRVEGHLTALSLEELDMECQTVLADHGSLALDLSAVVFADAEGVDLLRRLEQAGCRLEGRTGLVAELLAEAAAPCAPPSAPPPALESNDTRLVARLRAGDALAFETLVRQYGGRMLAIARRMTAVDEDARDVVQDAFLSAFRSIHSFEGTARLTTWLHRIVVNAALMKLRSKRRRPEESIDDLLPRFDDEGHFAEPAAPWERESSALLERHETRTIVRAAIDRLPDNYRSVLVLRDIEELDTDETAARLGILPNAVKTRLHRARQALRTLLARDLHRDDRAA